MAQELRADGEGGFEFTGITQIGFEQGSDNFAIVVEQVKFPTKRLLLFQQKLVAGVDTLVTSFWTGDYTETAMVLYTSTTTFTSTRARGVLWENDVVKDEITYSSGSLVAIEFTFDDVFMVEEIVNFELQNARTEWGETTLLTIANPAVLLPPPRALGLG